MSIATVGCDPEVFIREGDQIISAIGWVGGTKSHPIPVIRGALQEDNVLAEFNIDPASTSEEFIFNIEAVMGALQDKIGPNKSIEIKAHHVFGDEIRSQEAAMVFGCDPDLDAWTGQWNVIVNKDGLLRTAGGHVHIGYPQSEREVSLLLAQLCDYHLGLPSVILDTDTERRKLYGSAGACRIKPYGVEYRTLSNFWLRSKALQEWVFNTASSLIYQLDDLERLTALLSPEQLKLIINTGDSQAARSYCDLLGINIPSE